MGKLTCNSGGAKINR